MWKSEEEINKVYSDHIESLEMWGGECFPAEVGIIWQAELDAFRGNDE